MTCIKNDLSVMDGTDLNTGAGGGLRHRKGEEGRRGKSWMVNKNRRDLCITGNLAIAEKLLDLANVRVLAVGRYRTVCVTAPNCEGHWPIVT